MKQTQFIAKARYVKHSPYKMRLLADVIRGKSAGYALGWLMTYNTRRSQVFTKLIRSAIANAKHLEDVSLHDLNIREFRVDQGPIVRYYKPGAMGRANIQRRRMCHMSVILEAKGKEA